MLVNPSLGSRGIYLPHRYQLNSCQHYTMKPLAYATRRIVLTRTQLEMRYQQPQESFHTWHLYTLIQLAESQIYDNLRHDTMTHHSLPVIADLISMDQRQLIARRNRTTRHDQTLGCTNYYHAWTKFLRIEDCQENLDYKCTNVISY